MCKWQELGTEPLSRYESSLDLMKEVTVFVCEHCNKVIRIDVFDFPVFHYCDGGLL